MDTNSHTHTLTHILHVHIHTLQTYIHSTFSFQLEHTIKIIAYLTVQVPLLLLTLAYCSITSEKPFNTHAHSTSHITHLSIRLVTHDVSC